MAGTIETRRIAWVTGAGSGIGEAGAMALAAAGYVVVLTGRRVEALARVADAIAVAGGEARIEAGDVTEDADVRRIAGAIEGAFGRLDVLVNNAGTNIAERSFAQLDASGVDRLIGTNLSSAFYCCAAVLPMMRAQRDGLLIHIASWAGRHPTSVSGPAYSVAKQGLITMSHLLNEEECVHGIRSCVISPAETSTPILDRRPVPPGVEARSRMLQPGDLGRLIAYVAAQPAGVCINEVVISPTWNRLFPAVLAAETKGGT